MTSPEPPKPRTDIRLDPGPFCGIAWEGRPDEDWKLCQRANGLHTCGRREGHSGRCRCDCDATSGRVRDAAWAEKMIARGGSGG